MSASALVRPAVLAALALGAACLSGCGIQNDGHMFQRWADQVEQIKVDDRTPGEASDKQAPDGQTPDRQFADNGNTPVLDPMETKADTADVPGLRQPMKIDVVDRINMPTPDAATLRRVVNLVHAAVVSGPPPSDAEVAGLRRPIEGGPISGGRLVQLAAFTSDADARAAWRKFAAADPSVFARLAPRFEHADLGDKGQWVRVKVALPTAVDAAHRVCAAARLSPERCA
ncbi:MAG TPA: SPOR domain-containing protein [Caulobacteraceae bacterium]|jgi:hypothetical protein